LILEGRCIRGGGEQRILRGAIITLFMTTSLLLSAIGGDGLSDKLIRSDLEVFGGLGEEVLEFIGDADLDLQGG
jgi:hypothetical protein